MIEKRRAAPPGTSLALFSAGREPKGLVMAGKRKTQKGKAKKLLVAATKRKGRQPKHTAPVLEPQAPSEQVAPGPSPVSPELMEATGTGQASIPAPPSAPATTGAKVLGIPKRPILLRNPVFKYDETNTKVVAVIGQCTEEVFDPQGNSLGLCNNTREIHPQDAFQVRRCIVHQKRSNHKKIAARRKAARAAERGRLGTSTTTVESALDE